MRKLKSFFLNALLIGGLVQTGAGVLQVTERAEAHFDGWPKDKPETISNLKTEAGFWKGAFNVVSGITTVLAAGRALRRMKPKGPKA